MTRRYEVVPRPVISEPNDVLLRVTATTICGSDLHLYTGELPGMESGDVVGHEFMGIIEEKGAGISSKKKVLLSGTIHAPMLVTFPHKSINQINQKKSFGNVIERKMISAVKAMITQCF